ncbi:hypothetical protein [Psychroflexus aestuariivivens]|uniref:hypothetical protein n=1 Tax=Psychroflexus aestuariivivens TaxID=1795040 RepID=UPI000FD7DE6B|nr:hypothetical protein [Psychroflexus aestuariivivens]
MKKVLSLLILSIAFIACSDDDDNAGENNNPAIEAEGYLEIGNDEYNLKAGTLENLGSYEGSIFDFVLNLYSSNLITGNPITLEDDVVTAISMDLYVNSPFDLVETDYEKVSFDEISGNTFQAADIVLNFDVENETGTTRQIVEGTLTVVSVDPTYELEFTGTDNEGENVTFYYKGELEQIDSTE